MPNYQQGKIYTLRCYTDTSLIYVGSTTKKLCDRKSNHKFNSIKCPENSLYKVILDNGCWNNWYIELVENFPCNSKEELEKREGEVMREIGTLNSKIPRGLKQQDNPNYKSEYQKVIKEDVVFTIKKKENKKEYDKEYREKNKEKIQERKKTVKIICECGCEILKDGQAKHLRTEKHQMLLP